jgi:hypothetical protein
MTETKTSSANRFWFWAFKILSVTILIAIAVLAVGSVARILGWLTGASEAPVVAVVIPLIFGLLAVFGLIKDVPNRFGSVAAIWQTTFTAVLVIVFCRVYFDSATLGTFDRANEYRELYVLLDTAWDKIDPETLAAIQKLRIRARLAQLPAADFEPIIIDLIRPLILSGKPENTKLIQSTISEIEAALPTPGDKR